VTIGQGRRPLRVLMVAYYFPPIATSASMRPLAFCRHLPEETRAVRVIAGAPESVVPQLEVDGRLSDRLPAAIPVHRVTHANPLDTVVAWRNCLVSAAGPAANGHGAAPANGHGRANGNGHGSRGAFALMRAGKELLLHRAFAFPDRQRFWHGPAVRRGLQLAGDERPDVVFATGGPWTSLLVGRKLAAHYGVPLIADFRDPWTRNPFRSDVAAKLAGGAAALERSLCESAARIITNTEPLQRQFESDYPHLAGRFVTITNGFDSDGAAPAARAEVEPRTAPLTIGHFGTVYGHRSPRALLQALQGLAAAAAGTVPLRVRFVGRWEVSDPAINALVEELEGRGMVTREAPVPHEECARQMRSVDALLVLQPGAPLQIPGKIYEYVATGRPLLMLGGEGATAALVRDARLGTCCADEPRAVGDLLAALVDGRARLSAPAPDAVERFNYRSLTARLDTIFEDVAYRRANG
jgi:hypothetical protein